MNNLYFLILFALIFNKVLPFFLVDSVFMLISINFPLVFALPLN